MVIQFRTDAILMQIFVHRFGLNSMISEVIREDEHSNSSTNCDDSSKSNHSDDDFDRKSDNAVDYSDINELAEDLQVLMQEVSIFIISTLVFVFWLM